MRVAVVGRPGAWVAQRAAAAGHTVCFAELVRGAHTELGPGILRAETIEDAARDAELVVDFVPDELESKLEILSLLDRMAPPGCVLCTPTRVLSVRDLARCTYREGRVFGLRFLAPAHAEMRTTPESDAGCVAAAVAFWRSLGVAVECLVDAEALP